MARLCPSCGRRFGDEVLDCPVDAVKTYRVGLDAERVGKRVDGRFTVLEMIGSGGMGTVYRARQLSTDRDVALKLLRRELLDDEQAVRRFFREARAATRLTNPHTISVYDFGQDEDGSFYIAMELLRGAPLTSLTGPLPGAMDPLRAVSLVSQILASLEEAHAAGVLHRDLKPDNIFLLEQPPDFVKVLDFGIAKLLEDDPAGPRITSENETIGTPEYMSPEQASSRELDPRSDLYSLGVILFELLAGRRPFEGAPIDLLVRKLRDAAPSIRQASPSISVPTALEALVARLLAIDPMLRPASAAEARRLLGQAIAAAPAGAAMPPKEEPSGLLTSPSRHRRREGLTGKDGARLHKVLATATQVVTEGRRFYTQAADRSRSGPGRTTFARLAEECAVHEERLRKVTTVLESGGDPAAEIESVAGTDRDLGAQFEQWADAYAPSIREDEGLPEALDAGLRFERGVLDAWERAEARVEGPYERRLLERLLVRSRGQVGTLAEVKLRVLGLHRGPATGALHARLAGMLPVRRLRSGEALFREGEPGETLVVVVSGRFRVEVNVPGGDREVVGEIGPGDTVGEMTCIDPAPRSATVTAVVDSEVCDLDRGTLVALRDGRADIYVSIMRAVISLVTRRLRETDSRIAGLPRRYRVGPIPVSDAGGVGPGTTGAEPGFDPRKPAATGSLRNSDLLRLGDVAQSRTCADGAFLCREGEPGTSCFLLTRGQVEVQQSVEGRVENLATLSAGSLIGQIALADGRPRSASLRARGSCDVLELDRQTFESLVDQHHPMALRLQEMLATNGIRQLRLADRWLATVYGRIREEGTTAAVAVEAAAAAKPVSMPAPQPARPATAPPEPAPAPRYPPPGLAEGRAFGTYVRTALQEWNLSLQELDQIRVVVPEGQITAAELRARRLRID
jgi:CRP-like cAMP-binding protein/rubrerythrin